MQSDDVLMYNNGVSPRIINDGLKSGHKITIQSDRICTRNNSAKICPFLVNDIMRICKI